MTKLLTGIVFASSLVLMSTTSDAQHSASYGTKSMQPVKGHNSVPSFSRQRTSSPRPISAGEDSRGGREVAAPTRSFNRGRINFGRPAGTAISSAARGGGGSGDSRAGREMVAPGRSFNKPRFRAGGHFVGVPTAGGVSARGSRGSSSFRIGRVGGGGAGAAD